MLGGGSGHRRRGRVRLGRRYGERLLKRLPDRLVKPEAVRATTNELLPRADRSSC